MNDINISSAIDNEDDEPFYEKIIIPTKQESKCKKFLKRGVFFNYHHGIYHQGRRSFVTTASIFATFFMAISIIGVLKFNYDKLGTVKNVTEYALSNQMLN